MVKVEVEVHEAGNFYVVCWPWGREAYYTGRSTGLALSDAPSRIRVWKRKRDQAKRDFFIPSWDVT